MYVLQKELHFDNELVLQQIKHMGIAQMVRIQKSGYSARYTFKVGASFQNDVAYQWYAFGIDIYEKYISHICTWS